MVAKMVINIPPRSLAPASTSFVPSATQCFPGTPHVTSALKPTLQSSLWWVKGVALACLCSTRIASSVSLLGLASFVLPVHVPLIGNTQATNIQATNIQATNIQATNIQNQSAPYVPPPDAGTPHPTGGTGSNLS